MENDKPDKTDDNSRENLGVSTPYYFSTVVNSGKRVSLSPLSSLSLLEAKDIWKTLGPFEKRVLHEYLNGASISHMIQKFEVSQSSISRSLQKIKTAFGIVSQNRLETLSMLRLCIRLNVSQDFERDIRGWLTMTGYDVLADKMREEYFRKKRIENQKKYGTQTSVGLK